VRCSRFVCFPREAPVLIDYATANGTAATGTDYLGVAGTLTFAPGETTRTVPVAVVGDRADEAAETFLLNLSNPRGALLADGQAMATITDDDPTPSLSITENVILSEGNAGTKTVTFTVTLSRPSGQS
jgi:chitinase